MVWWVALIVLGLVGLWTNSGARYHYERNRKLKRELDQYQRMRTGYNRR